VFSNTTDFEVLVESYQSHGGDNSFLTDRKSASLVVSHNKILRKKEIPGVHIEGEETANGARARITVDPGTVVERPVHLCFGLVPREGIQEIMPEFHIGDGAKVEFVAHCSFPNAVKVKHLMEAKIYIGKKAEMTYSETHYHGEVGGIEVVPVVDVVIDEGGKLKNEFKLTRGSVGSLNIDYRADLRKDAVCELDAKVYGKKQDVILVKESIYLNGENSRGLAKSRIVASDRCTSEVIGEVAGNAPFARGHVDCVEIIKGREARASAIPRLLVIDDRAKLTHEAAIGSVDKKQVETLMARGLDENEAVDVVVKGMLQ
jgi:Fe-S cluster assembly scaffold protein SufB